MKFVKDKIIQASEWPDLIGAVNDQTPPGNWIFRALEAPDDKNIIFQDGAFHNVTIPVRSSFDRAWDSRAWSPAPERWRYEAWMLREFKRAAYHYRSDLPAPDHHLEWLALARHYEMPSRLVDFSYTFYVAAYFAVSGKGKEKHGFILAINLDQLKQKTEDKLPSWGLTPPPDDWDFHNPVVFREFAFEKKRQWVAPAAPSRKNERLFNQKGLFLCPGSIEKTFEENLSTTLPCGIDFRLICLHRDLRTPVIQDLRRMNVDMRILYPDLSGFAQSLRDLVHMDIDYSDTRFRRELERSISPMPWS